MMVILLSIIRLEIYVILSNGTLIIIKYGKVWNMKKTKVLLSFILMIVCLLNNYNCVHIHAAKNSDGIIAQVEKYTSHFDEEEIKACIENGEYQKAKDLVEEAKDGYQERWDYVGLTTNDLYIAYQFKEYMSDDFFAKGWWAKTTSWLSGLFYNDELKEYLSLQSPGKNKYKDMLKKFIGDTQETWNVYYFYWDNGLREYGGTSISTEEFATYSGSNVILQKISEDGFYITSIYKRQNGIININCCDGWSNANVRVILENENEVSPFAEEYYYEEGIIKAALIPEIATY